MAEHSPPLMSLWQPSRPPLKPLVRSRLTYKLANYCGRVIELLVMPRYDWGTGPRHLPRRRGRDGPGHDRPLRLLLRE